MFDKILVSLLVICGIVFLRLTFDETQNNKLIITDTNTTQHDTSANTYTNELERALSRWKTLGITSFSDLQTFRPNDYITRAEFAKMIVMYITHNTWLKTLERKSDCLFYDFSDAGEFAIYVYDACNMWIMHGNNNYFYPQNYLSRAEAIASIVRYTAWKMDENTSPRFRNYIEYANQQWYIDNQNMATMEQKMVRFEALILLRRVSQKS